MQKNFSVFQEKSGRRFERPKIVGKSASGTIGLSEHAENQRYQTTKEMKNFIKHLKIQSSSSNAN